MFYGNNTRWGVNTDTGCSLKYLAIYLLSVFEQWGVEWFSFALSSSVSIGEISSIFILAYM
jgi:hypothetical protein